MIYLMDSGICAKSLRNPDLHINELGCRMDFPGREIGIFPGVGCKHFFRGANSGEILLYQRKTERKTFFKFQTPVSPRSPCTPLSTLMLTRIIM